MISPTITPRFFCEEIVNGKDHQWLDDFVYVAACNLKNRNEIVIPFDGNDYSTLEKHHPTDRDYIIGSVEATVHFFKLVGWKTPQYLGYPESLRNYFRRDHTIVKVKDLPTTYPYFIKPAFQVKKFTGEVIDSKDKLDFAKKYCGLLDTEDVLCTKKMDFISEYRCFVFEGKLIDIKHYKGDSTKFIDVELVHAAINAYNDAPIAYTLDFGVYKREAWAFKFIESTALVEVNDFWAIGGYGLDPNLYIKLLTRRFNQIKQNGK